MNKIRKWGLLILTFNTLIVINQRNYWTTLSLYSFFSDLYRFNNGKAQVIDLICCQFLRVLFLYLRLDDDPLLHKCTRRIKGTVHTQIAKHKNTNAHTGTPVPVGMLSGWLSARNGGCNYTGALCEKCVSEMGSSLCFYLAWLLPQPRNTIVPEKDTMCMYTYVRVGMMWFYTEITQKSPDTKKGLRYIHQGPMIKEIEGEQVCAQDREIQKHRLSITKEVAQVILQFPLALSLRAVHTQAQCLAFVQTDFISQILFAQPNLA